MPDTKISAMPAAATLDGTEILPLVQAGANVQETVTALVTETIAVNPASYRTTLQLGTMATQNANNVTITGGAISDTTVAGYVPTTRAVNSGTGLTGGGDLSVNRTLAIANTGVVAGTYGASNKIPVLAINAQGQVTTASEQTLSMAALNMTYGQFLQNGQTTLTASISNNSTTPVQVASTSEFASAGYFIIENEIIQYTGKTATTFTGITRGVKGTTNVAHDPGVYITEAAANASGTVSQAVAFEIEAFANKVSIENSSEITFDATGIYNVQFSLQLLNYTESEDNVTVWFRKNGTDIGQSASIQLVPGKHGAYPGAIIIALNLLVDVTAGGNIQLYWSSGSGNTVVATFPEGTNPTHPLSPAAILTVTQVA